MSGDFMVGVFTAVLGSFVGWWGIIWWWKFWQEKQKRRIHAFKVDWYFGRAACKCGWVGPIHGRVRLVQTHVVKREWKVHVASKFVGHGQSCAFCQRSFGESEEVKNLRAELETLKKQQECEERDAAAFQQLMEPLEESMEIHRARAEEILREFSKDEQ
jgi:hypothetical protein